MSNVAELKATKATSALPLDKAPALGMSIQVDLGSGRIATLQTFVDSTCSIFELNAMLDKMTGAGDRQRAHYKIEELERDLKQEQKLLAQHADDLARIDKDYDAAQAKRFDAIEKMQKTVDTFMATARDNHVASNRRTEWALKGTEKSHVTAVNSGIKKLQDEIATATNERDVTHANTMITVNKRNEIIEHLQAEIAACKATVEKGRGLTTAG